MVRLLVSRHAIKMCKSLLGDREGIDLSGTDRPTYTSEQM